MQFFRRSGPNDPVAGLIQVRRPDRVRLRSYARESGVLFAFRLPLDSEPDVGTTQDALQKAEEAGKMHSPSAARELLGGVELASAGGASGLENLAETGELKSNLLALGPKGKAKRLVLVNNVRGTGASGHATRLAASLTATSDLRVLILDPTRWVSSFREGFDSDQPTGLFDLFSRAPAKTSPIQKVGPGELYAARLTIDSPQLVDFFESGEIDSFLASLGADFDFVLLEIPGSAPFQECRSLCSQADAVVLVLGTNGEWETEGNDRRDMALPGRQDELAERVLAARPDAVVALNVGSPVTVDFDRRTVVCHYRDVTEERRLEAELARTERLAV